MPIRSVENIEEQGKKILVRVDYNVDLDELEKKGEHFKITSSKATVDALRKKNSKIALLTHIGEPNGREASLSSSRLVKAAEKALGIRIHYLPEVSGPKIAEALTELPDGEALILENVRFWPGETSNDETFAAVLAESFDFYVNESFGVDHRNHASLTSITKILPSYAGLRLIEEMRKLDEVRLRPEHPAVAIIGGAKISTKLPLIQALELNYDHILVGGKIANEALDTSEAFSSRVHLPLDFSSSERFDIGPKTIATYAEIITQAKTIIWNGPMGKFEDEKYAAGTDGILQAILGSSAFTVMGGGESLEILEKHNVHEKIAFVSTGGGAMLEYMSGKKLPALVALEKNSRS